MNALKVEIESSEVTTKSGTSKQGKPFSLREQSGYVYTLDDKGTPQKHPQTFKFIIDGEQPPYAPGMYSLDMTCLYVGRFGQLEVGHIKLKPAVTAAQYAAGKAS